MGLDDFKGEPTDEYEELKDELSQNSPPDGNDTWKEHEPGAPDWANDICGGEVSAEDVEQYDSDSILYVRLNTDENTGTAITIASDVYVDLEDKE